MQDYFLWWTGMSSEMLKKKGGGISIFSLFIPGKTRMFLARCVRRSPSPSLIYNELDGKNVALYRIRFAAFAVHAFHVCVCSRDFHVVLCFWFGDDWLSSVTCVTWTTTSLYRTRQAKTDGVLEINFFCLFFFPFVFISWLSIKWQCSWFHHVLLFPFLYSFCCTFLPGGWTVGRSIPYGRLCTNGYPRGRI